MVGKGSLVDRHTNDLKSAKRILSMFTSRPSHGQSKHEKVVLDIQEQMVDDGKTLKETDAGQELEKSQIQLHKQYQYELEQLKTGKEDALRLKDEETACLLYTSDAADDL